MELELGLKVTRTREDVSSSVDFRFSKDPFGPLVLSRETDSRFIIILHLKGFKKEGIEIDINEEGNRITIRGRKPVEEMVVVRWMAWRKEVELRTFKKVFGIPDFVDLDKIKARFDDDEATLTITMPKRVMGITRFEIEEERVEFGDVSEVENREETEDGEEAGVETEDGDSLEKIQEVDEQQHKDKMLEFAQEEETIGPSREQEVMEQRDSQEKNEPDGFGSRAFEEIEEQVPDELEKKMSDDDGEGLSKVQGIEESKIQEVVEGEGVEEKKKNVKLDTKSEDAKMDERFTPNVAETETKAEEFEYGKLEADEVHKKEGEENAKVGTQNEDIGEEQFKREKRHEKQERIKELVEEQAPKTEKNIAHYTPKPVQERCEEKQKNQAEDYKEKVNDVGARKVQESTRQQKLDEPARREKESKSRELVESKRKDAEREIKEHESYRPKILGEQEKIQELVEEKTDHSRNGKVKEEEEIAEKKTDFGDNDISRKVQDIEQRDSEAAKNIDAKIGEGFTPNIAETEVLKSDNIEPDEVDKMHELVEKNEEEEENAKVRRESEDSSSINRLQETEEEQFQEQRRHNKQENNQREEHKEKTVETEENTNDAGSRKKQELDEPAKCKKESKRNDAEEETETKEQESHEPKTLRGQEKIQEIAEEENTNFSKLGKIKEEEETAEEKKEHSAETETKAGLLESDKLDAEEENEDAKVETESEDIGLIKLQEIEEQESQGEIQTEEAETITAKDIPKPVQEIEMPEKKLIKKYKEKAVDTEEKINDASSRKVQDVIRQQDMAEPERCKKKETEEKSIFSRNEVKEEEEIAKQKTEFGDIEQRDPDAMKGQVERDKTQEVVLEEKVTDCSKETLADNDKSREVQEIDEQQSHEEDTSIEEFGDAEMGERFTPNVAETETKAEFESDEVDKMHEVVEKKKEKDENGKVRRQSEENSSIKKLQETEEEQKLRDKQQINEASSRKVQEIRQHELYEPAKCEKESKRNDAEKEISETETKELEHEKIQELAEEENMEFSKVGEAEETAKKKTELGDDAMLTEVGDTEQRGSDAVKRQEEKDKFQESVQGEKVSDGGKGIITMAETLAENDKSRIVQEIDEEDTSGKQFQKLAEVEDVESEKKTIEADKGIKDSTRAAKEIERKGTTIQEIQEQEKKDETDRPENFILDSQFEQDRIEEGEKTQESVKEETKDCKEEDKVNEELKTKTDDDDNVRKVQGVKEHELYKPKEMVLGKTDNHEKKVAESEKKAEFGGLRRVHGVEEKALQEPKIHKEPDKPRITEEEESSGQEKERTIESQTITDVQNIKEVGPDEPEPQEKQCKIQEVVGVGHDGRREEEKQDREVMSKEDSSKKVQEIERQNYDESKRCIVIDKKQKDKTRAMEEEEIVERKTKARDCSLGKVQEDEDSESSKPCKMIQEPVEMGTSDFRETVKKQNEDDILRSQETEITDLDEFERHSEQSNITQTVEDEQGEGRKSISDLEENMKGDSSGKFQKQKSYESWRQEESEEMEKTVKEEATDHRDKNTRREKGYRKERYEQVAETKTKVEDAREEQEVDNQELENLEGVLREEASDFEKDEEELVDYSTGKIQETEKKDSHRSDMDEKLDIFQAFVDDKTDAQENKKTEEVAAMAEMIEEQEPEKQKEQNKVLQTSDPEVKKEDEKSADMVTKNEAESSREVQTIDEQEKHKEQNKILETSDPRVKEQGKERISKKDADKEAPNTIKDREMKVQEEQHVQELAGKGNGGNEGKQGKTVESMSRERFKTRSEDEKKNQEPGYKIEELERKETRKPEVKLVTEDDNLKKDQDSLQKESSNASEGKIQELDMLEKGEPETKANDGKSRKIEMPKMLEAEENKKLEKIRKPTGEKTNAPQKEKEGNEKISEEEMKDKSDSKIQDQKIKGEEPYKILKTGEHDKIPEPIVEGTKCHREEEKGMEKREFEDMKRMAEDVSSGNVRKTETQESDGVKKLGEIQEDRDIKGSLEENTQEHGDEKGRYKALPRTKSTEDSSQFRDVQEKESDQKQELMVDEKGKEEQKENTEKIPQVKPKGSDDSSRKSETEERELTGLNEQKKRVKHQELVERETSNQRKEEKQDGAKPKREVEYDHSCKIQDNKEENSDKLERHEAQEQEKKKASVKKEIANQSKKQEDQEDTKSTDDSTRKIEKDEQKQNEKHDKNLGLVLEKRNDCRNQDVLKADKELADANSARKLNEIEEKESTEMEKNEISDSIQEEDDDENITKEELKEPVQQKRDNLKDKATAEAKTRSKDSESRKMGDIKEKQTSKQSRLEEQENNREAKFGDSSSKKIQELDKEESIKAEKQDKIQEPVYRETSEDDSEELEVEVEDSEEDEELEVEVEDSEEDWEAEVIQDNDKIRLGFRLVGGSALFMSLIVIVIRIIRSKKTIKCYKF